MWLHMYNHDVKHETCIYTFGTLQNVDKKGNLSSQNLTFMFILWDLTYEKNSELKMIAFLVTNW